MILSHEHRFIFIKGVKVAGTSAEIALSQLCGPADVITPVTPTDERYRLDTAGTPRNYASHLYPRWLRSRLERKFIDRVRTASTDQLQFITPPRARFYNHMTLLSVLELVPGIAGYEVIFVERSPYAKILSLANWSRNERRYQRGEKLETSPASSEESVDEILCNGGFRKVLNIDHYRDRRGEVRGTMWRTETLAEDIAHFCKDRGSSPPMLVHAKQGFGSERVDPSRVLRPDQIARINELFADEFAAFGWPMIET